MSKVIGIYVKFYHDHSPVMVISRYPGYKFRKFYFLSNSILHFGKVTKFGENWLNNKNVTGKKQNSGWKTPPVLIGLMKEALQGYRSQIWSAIHVHVQ